MNLQDRNNKIIERFKNLENAASIARDFDVTRAYLGQLVVRELGRDEVNKIKLERSEKLRKERELNYFNRYRMDDDLRAKTLERANARHQALKEASIGKIDFHMQAKNYFANVACLLFMISDKTENALDKQMLSNIGNELIYVDNNYVIKRNLKKE